MEATDIQRSVYTYIGQRIRDRRKFLKMNQAQLAEVIGVSYQQVQKYENGSSQLSVSKLLQVASALQVSPVYFYEGVPVEECFGSTTTPDRIKRLRTEPFHILLVEDNPGDVILFRRAVKACDESAVIHSIYDPEMVIDYLCNAPTKYGRQQPDIVVLDLALPKIAGMKLLELIKKNSLITDIPVLILTNSLSMNEMREAYRLGAAGFIQKSVELGDYNRAIEAATRYWSQAVALPRM